MANEQSLVSISATHDELCNWELINQSDYSDDEDLYDIELIDLLDSVSSSCSEEEQEEEGPTELEHRDEDQFMSAPQHEHVGPTVSYSYATVVQLGQHPGVSSDNFSNYGVSLGHVSCRGEFYDDGLRNIHDDKDDDKDDHDEEGDEDDEENGGYDVDDELVPWDVKDRFGRQRMRKLGKRAFAKMTKSKKSAYIYTRPGCVRGKHGLGLKAY